MHNAFRFSFRLAGIVLLALGLSMACARGARAGCITSVSETGAALPAAPFREDAVQYPVPDGIPDDWFPLRAVSGLFHLEYTVAGGVLTITDTLARANGDAVFQRQYLLDGRWSGSVRILNGCVCVEPQILLNSRSVRSFSPDGRVVCLAAAGADGWITGTDDFRSAVCGALYTLWKRSPADYSFVAGTLSAIRQGTGDDLSRSGASACVYPGSPVCTVLKYSGTAVKLASILAHEARHVSFCSEWQAAGCQGDYYTLSEQIARAYGDQVYQRLTAAK